MVFQCINICQVPWEVLETAAFGLGFQHLPRDLTSVNAWKTMFNFQFLESLFFCVTATLNTGQTYLHGTL